MIVIICSNCWPFGFILAVLLVLGLLLPLFCWSFLFPTSSWFTLHFFLFFSILKVSLSVPVLRSMKCFGSLSVWSTIKLLTLFPCWWSPATVMVPDPGPLCLSPVFIPIFVLFSINSTRHKKRFYAFFSHHKFLMTCQSLDIIYNGLSIKGTYKCRQWSLLSPS